MTQARDLADGKFDTDTLVVDAANNRVGVGTTSPSSDLHVSGGSNSTIRNQSSDTAWFMSTNTTGMYLHNESNTPTILTTNNTERLRILAGGGLTFNGDTAAANALDDYEEGTWTPVFGGSTGNGTLTYSVQNGRYTKVGRLVTFTGQITASSAVTGGGGTLQIRGLPYTAAATSSFWFSSYIGYFNNLSAYGTSTNDLKLLGPIQNDNMLRFHAFDNAGEGGTNPTQGHVQNGTVIFFGGAYDIG